MINIAGLDRRANAAGKPGHRLVAPERNREPGWFFLGADRLSSTPGTVRCGAGGNNDHPFNSMSDRVIERRRAAQLARHYRDQENLTIGEIARQLGRAEATVKAYLYDPS